MAVTSELRQRTALNKVSEPQPAADFLHPSGKAKYGRFRSYLRAFTFSVYFMSGIVVTHITQILGSPLYFINKELYYAYMSLTKANFGLLTTTMTQWWAPTVIRVSGDASVAAQLSITPDGRIECSFPERLVLIANHQIYTDWLYLWWVGYTNNPQMHGHIYIILKESLKWIPFIGPGCMFLSFIFMSRKMATDRPRLAHRLGKLKMEHEKPDGTKYQNPMWLLLFPEGTNLSGNGRKKSAAWAAKSGQIDLQHLMLPRSTGMYFCLTELKGTVDYVYDCTVAYEGIPRGKYGEDFFSLSSTYFQGRPPKSVNFYWRRFAVADIPLDTAEEFDAWMRKVWAEKDELMEQYMASGRFPSNGAGIKGHIETEVRTKYGWEFVKIFTMLGAFGLLFNVILKVLRHIARG
ncbi:acyltransferase-domain-containing protein [Microdochium bolleyi]|uniref:Acyltransferase-domain-containing protein n=1 Tax=Microdochium bolleyi TaxID=196109 RepID=A0A136J5M0_9PEZI|nr:acyltransferase-domain-containing protein [Microdochium bolleyi]